MYKQILASTLLALGIMTSGAALADPVYMLAQIEIKDKDTFFKKYGAKTGPILKQAEAKILVATPTVDTLEGKWPGNWTVVLEFPSEKLAKKWWDSADYQDVARPHRLKSTKFGNMILAPAFAGFGDKMKK